MKTDDTINEARADVPRGQRRSANKARRGSAIRKAAERLIVETGGTDFTMQHLANEAGASLATTYNLIGTKAAVLYALLDASHDELAATQVRLPASGDTGDIVAMVRHAVDFFAAKPDYYRPLMRYLLGVYEPDRRPLFMARALDYWRLAVGPPENEDLAQALHLSFAGALHLWVHVEIEGGAFGQLMEQQARLLIAGVDQSHYPARLGDRPLSHDGSFVS
jgi:AcrR family transcriptional regulator